MTCVKLQGHIQASACFRLEGKEIAIVISPGTVRGFADRKYPKGLAVYPEHPLITRYPGVHIKPLAGKLGTRSIGPPKPAIGSFAAPFGVQRTIGKEGSAGNAMQALIRPVPAYGNLIHLGKQTIFQGRTKPRQFPDSPFYLFCADHKNRRFLFFSPIHRTGIFFCLKTGGPYLLGRPPLVLTVHG
jgi:hypothetical protein